MPTALTINQLFTPSPSGIVPNDPAATPVSGSWLDKFLATGATLGLSTTAWNPGDPTRTLMAIQSVVESQQDSLVSIMAQGGFLDWAATGTVTYELINGTTTTVYVTPDPSNPSQNPTGAPGWLDVLANEVYNVARITATFASGSLYLVNTSASTYNLAGGQFHVANALTSVTPAPTYSNTSAITLTPSPNTNVSAVSIVGGLATVTVGSTSGITVGQVIFINGTGNGTIDNTWQIVTSVPDGTHLQFVNAGAVGSGSTGKVYVPAAFAFQADVVGASSSAVVGALTTVVTTQIGVESYNTSSFIGANAESNNALVLRCRAKLATLSMAGPKGAYVFTALSAAQLLANNPIAVPGGGTVGLVDGSIVDAYSFLDTATGDVTTVIANAGGATEGSVNNPVTACTAANPIAITTLNPHLMTTGDYCYVSAIQGVNGANGYFQITKTGANSFTLNGSMGTGSYLTGGTVECGDLGIVDNLINIYATPDNFQSTTVWAASADVSVSATVYVPAFRVPDYTAAVGNTLAAYFAGLPIGGVSNVEAQNIIPIDAVIGLLYAAGIIGANQTSYVTSVANVTLNGQPVDLQLTSTSHVVFTGGIASISIVGI